MTDTSLRIPDRGWWTPPLVPTPLRHGAPNAAMLTAGLDPSVTRGYQALLDAWDRRYIDTATGTALDRFGARINAPRVTSEIGEDEAYRSRIKALLRYGLTSTSKPDIKNFCQSAYNVPVSVTDSPGYPPTLTITFLEWTRQVQDSPVTLKRIKPAGVILSILANLPPDVVPNTVNDFSVDETYLGGDGNVIVLL